MAHTLPKAFFKQLGKVLDSKLASQFGVSQATVSIVRRAKGIPSYRTVHLIKPLNKRNMRKLGKMSDAELGRRVGLSRERIRQLRTQHNIPPFCPARKK